MDWNQTLMHPRAFLLLGLAIILAIFAFGLVVQGPLDLDQFAPSLSLAAAGNPNSATGNSEGNDDRGPRLAAADRCGPHLVYLPETGGCTHGLDPAPPGLDADRRAPTLGSKAASVRAASLACDGDGQTGPRVQILYVRGAQSPSQYGSLVAPLQAVAADADDIVRRSAAATGGSRQIRFVHDASCAPIVLDVPIPGSALGSFGAMTATLKAMGYNRQDRIYLTFADTTAAGICGIASIWDDDRPGAQNWNNIGPSYARVDAGCWNGGVVAHELLHTLGGVQLSAPNTSNGFHCTDDHDVLCYRDAYGAPPVRIVCADPSYERLLDCNNDDYFHTAPAAGTYLATHWNAANSRFLIKGPGDPTGSRPFDTIPPRVKLVLPQVVTGGKRIRIAAKVSDPVGVASVEFRLCRGKRCAWSAAKPLAIDRARPFRTAWKAPKRGTFTIISLATDTSGNVKIVKKSITVKPTKAGKAKKKR